MPGVPGIHQDDRVVRHHRGQVGAQALGPDRQVVAGHDAVVPGTPGRLEVVHLSQPRRPARGRGRVGQLPHPAEHRAGVTEHPGLQRIVPAERDRFDVDLDGGRADRRHRPEMGRHATRLRADEADEIGPVDDLVRALARIGPDHARAQPVGAGDAGPAVRRCRHRDPESLSQRDELAARAGPADPAAGHDHRPGRGLEQGQGSAHGLVVGPRPEWRYRRELGLDDVIEHSCLPCRAAPRSPGSAGEPVPASRLSPTGTRTAACRAAG